MNALVEVQFQATDLSGQKTIPVRRLPADATVGELIDGLRTKLNLPAADAEGRALTYHALSEKSGRHLHASERATQVIEREDRIVLEPNIDAGNNGRC